MSTFNKYFQEELSYLRELGREFSESYPMLAPMLADRGADPDVERLLEGVAFLTGRIRQKLDDEIPEIIVAVAQLLFPELVRPLPGCTIVEIAPVLQAVRERIVVPRGAEFGGAPSPDGTSCLFRAASACDVTPLVVDDVRLEALPAGRQELKLLLRSGGGSKVAEAMPPVLRLHFAGETSDALRLWAWVLEHGEDVVLRESSADGRVLRETRLGRRALTTSVFESEHSLLPTINTSFPGFRLLQEYYALPQKFAFVDLVGTREGALALGQGDGRVSVSIILDRKLVDAAPVDKDSVRIHCVPVVNLFETTAEPIRLDPTRERYLVRPAGLPPKHSEVYAIQRVTTILRRRSERVEVPCFYAFTHETAKRDAVFYTPHYSPSVVGDGVDVRVSFGTPVNANALPDADVASIELLATNRALASTLRAGDVRVATTTSPAACTFRNLFAVTPHVPPPFGRELHWRVIAHAAMGLRSLTETDVLRSVLDVYNFQAVVDRRSARANELRMEALKGVRVRPMERLFRGAPVRGIDIEIALEESGFAGDGDIYLFGAVLERFFAHYVSLNSFSRTSVEGATSKLRFTWPARSGSVTML